MIIAPINSISYDAEDNSPSYDLIDVERAVEFYVHKGSHDFELAVSISKFTFDMMSSNSLEVLEDMCKDHHVRYSFRGPWLLIFNRTKINVIEIRLT